MTQKRNYYLVKENCYARKRMKRIALRKALMLDLSIGLAGISTIFLFNTTSLKADDYKINKIVDFEECIEYLDMDKIENQNLVNELNEYYQSGYGSGYNALATLEEEYELVNINHNDTKKELTFEQQVIMKYCAIYQVDYYLVYNKLFDLTDGFSSEEYLNGTIPGISFKKEPINFDNKEILLAMSVRCCAQTPQIVGLNDIHVDAKFESNMDLLEQINDFSLLFGLDRNEVYSIFRAENNLGSNFTNMTNNYGSLKTSSGFVKYDNVTEGVLEACAEIFKFKNKYNIKDSGIEFFKKVQPFYAPTLDVPDGEAEMNSVWIKNASCAYQEACSMNLFNEESYKKNLKLDQMLYQDYAQLSQAIKEESRYY